MSWLGIRETREKRMKAEYCEEEREISCLPCPLGDSSLAPVQFTSTGLPKAAASQASRAKAHSSLDGWSSHGSSR